MGPPAIDKHIQTQPFAEFNGSLVVRASLLRLLQSLMALGPQSQALSLQAGERGNRGVLDELVRQPGGSAQFSVSDEQLDVRHMALDVNPDVFALLGQWPPENLTEGDTGRSALSKHQLDLVSGEKRIEESAGTIWHLRELR